MNTLQFIIFNKKFFIKRSLISLNDLIKEQNTSGLKLELKGRLKGVKRARKLELMKGKIKAQTFSFSNQAKQNPIQTKWGKLGLQIILGKC